MPVSIDIGPDNRIWADIPYNNGKGPRAAKSIAGARPKYEKRTPPQKDRFIAWTYPLEMGVCRAFRQTFGKSLRVSERLANWAREEVKREQRMIDLARGQGTEIELRNLTERAPKLADAVNNRPYQKVGAEFIRLGEGTLNADQPGLGKTLQTLAGLVEVGAKRILVIAPRTAIETVWAREVERWTGYTVRAAVGSPRQRERAILDVVGPDRLDAPRVLVINPEMVRTKKIGRCLFDGCDGFDLDCAFKRDHVHEFDYKYHDLFWREWDAIIVDECHKGLIGKNVMSKNISQTRLGMMQLALAKDGRKVALSGTPYRGKPELLWGVMNWLRPDVFTSFWRWVDTYFETTEGYGGSKVIGDMREDRKEAYDRMLSPYVLRRTKAEVAADLPPKMYGGTPLDPEDEESPVAVWLEMEPAQQKQYIQMAEQSFVELDGGLIEAIGDLPQITRLKQLATCSWGVENFDQMVPNPLPSNKYNWLLDFIAIRAEEGQKVVVASQYTKVINAFAAQLEEDGYHSYVLTGETKMRDRKRDIEDFQTNPDSPLVYFINTYAGGVAVTLDAADDIVFLDETFIPDDQEQAEDRIHRVSRTDHQVTVWKLLSLGTIEESIARTTEYREGRIKERLDGARGIEFAKMLLRQK